MGFKIQLGEEWVEYIPDINDNRDDENPAKCMIKYISQADQDGLTDNMIGSQRDGFRKQKGKKWSAANLIMINKHVKDIENVSIRTKDGTDVEIKTMEKLYKIPQYKELYKDIADALDAGNCLEEFEVKN